MVPDKVEKLCLRAQQAIAARDWEKAKQAYLMALGVQSGLPDVHYGLATVYFQLQELTSAAHHFREVARLDPLRTGAHINLGAVLNLLGQFDEAIAALRRAIQLDGNRVEGHYNLGVVYKHKGQLDLALTAYREALRLNPRMPDAHINIGNVYMEKDQPKMALHHYKLALEIRPKWTKAIEAVASAQELLNPSPVASKGPPAARPAPASAPGGDMDQPVDPATHHDFLTGLHDAAVVTEDAGRLLHKIVGDEIAPVVVELARVLLRSSGPRSDLDACVAKFETALNRMRTTHQALKNSVDKLEKIGDHFPSKG